VYLDMDLLSSSRRGVTNAFDLSAGVRLSFESSPSRRVLLPFYALEVGALFDEQVDGAIGHLTPGGGLHLYASPELTVSLSTGYLLPLRGDVLDEQRGLRARLGAAVSFW
jgi:hypothetical protein